MSTFTEGQVIAWGRTRYEFVRDGCAVAGFGHCKYADEDPITVVQLDHRGRRPYGSLTQCLPGARCHAVGPPRCITCGEPLTADDPVVTTLGPRCKKHF